MPDASRPLVVMGRVLGSYGVRGWIKVEPFTERADGLAAYRNWWLGLGGEWREMTVAESASHGRHLVARLENCATREEAARFRGCEIALPREAMPKPGEGEFYRADLIGLRVVNRSGEELGGIAGWLDHGAHPVMRVRWESGERHGERLLPFVPKVVEQVDLEARVVRVDWEADW